jgi:hypothetical protein
LRADYFEDEESTSSSQQQQPQQQQQQQQQQQPEGDIKMEEAEEKQKPTEGNERIRCIFVCLIHICFTLFIYHLEAVNLQQYNANKLNHEIESLEEEVNSMNPNLNAIKEYREKHKIYKERLKEFEAVTAIRDR